MNKPKSVPETSEDISPSFHLLDSLSNLAPKFQINSHKKSIELKNLKAKLELIEEGENSPIIFETKEVTVDDILKYTKGVIPGSLLKLSPKSSERAIELNKNVLNFIQDNPEEDLNISERIDEVIKIVETCINNLELQDEIYLQLLRLSHGNPNVDLRLETWELWWILTHALIPSKEYEALLSEYIEKTLGDELETEEIKIKVNKVQSNLKRTMKVGTRKTGLNYEEIESLLKGTKLITKVNFLNNRTHILEYDPATTVQEAVEEIARKLKFKNYSTFTLFQIIRNSYKKDNMKNTSEIHLALDDNRYISDILEDGYIKMTRGLIFKKRIFKENENLIREKIFIDLCYDQIQYDYLLGNYPLETDELIVELCALQIGIEFGLKLKEKDPLFKNAVETYINKQEFVKKSEREWRSSVFIAYSELEKIKELKLEFLNLIRNLPFGNSVFFPLRSIKAPRNLIPSKSILSINQDGLHFFNPIPREYLFSIELKYLMQFGSSSQAVFLKMRITEEDIDIFQFQTRQGEDICIVLQTLMSDVMLKKFKEIQKMNAEEIINNSECESDIRLNEKEFQIYELERKEKELDDEIELKVKELQSAKDEMKLVIEDNFNIKEDMNLLKKEIYQNKKELNDLNKVKQDIDDKLEKALLDVRLNPNYSIEVIEVEKNYLEKSLVLDSCLKEVGELEVGLKGQVLEEEELDKKLKELEKIKIQEKEELELEINEVINISENQKISEEAKIKSLNEELEEVKILNETAEVELNKKHEYLGKVSELKKICEETVKRKNKQEVIMSKQIKRIEYLDNMYKQEQVTRKKLYNEIENKKGKIRVFCRVRPILEMEKEKGHNVKVSIPDQFTITHPWKGERKDREYIFDQIFLPETKQDKVFEDTKHLIQSAIDGYNVCIFAYGQTGSGKTFTINGTKDLPGLAPRGIFELMNIIKRDTYKYQTKITCYMIELYMDTILDLFRESNKKPPKLEIKKDNDGMIMIQGVKKIQVTSIEQIMRVIDKGQKKRHVSNTLMNTNSSRSHSIMSFIIECTNNQTQQITKGKLSFVDLAGSERLKKSKAAGDQMKEAQAINKSLAALGDVISALATGSKHVPYRNHKLTMLMSDSLGGNAKTLMFVNVSPTDGNLDETKNSLGYASRVRAIKNNMRKIMAVKEETRLKLLGDYWKNLASKQDKKLIKM